jgi:hypothetical protein
MTAGGPSASLTRRRRSGMSTDTSVDQLQLGPVDFLVVEFPGSRMTGEGLPLLVDLVDRGIVRVLDLVFVKKRDDGKIVSLDIGQLEDGGHGLSVFQGAKSGLMGQDDIDALADVLEPGSSAALLLYENTWAAPLATALIRNGARLVASARIPAPVLLEALDALEATEAGGEPGTRSHMVQAASAAGSRKE